MRFLARPLSVTSQWLAEATNAINALLRPDRTAYNPTTAPNDPEDGMVYYDSAAGKLKVRAGGVWVDLH